MNKQELIDKAVEQFGGKFPDVLSTALYTLRYTPEVKSITHYPFLIHHDKNADSHVCTKDEFEQRAKELGWINGYKWGVEYPTNGKMPDLPFDTLVEVDYKKLPPWQLERVSDALWYAKAYEPVAFRIVDQRYKPKEPELQTKPDNSWHEGGERPPVGVECEWSTNGGRNWHKTKIIFSDKTVVLTESYQLYKIECPDLLFRPIKSEREKFVDAAANAFHSSCMHDYSGQPFLDGLAGMYDAGFKAPDEKSSS